MRVSIGFLGILRDSLGQNSVEVDLPDGSRFSDLLEAIAPLMERKVAWAWDRERRAFSPRVVISRKEGRGHTPAKIDPETPLVDDEEFVVFPPIAGG